MSAEKIEPGIYMIKNTGTGTVVTLKGGSADDGTSVQGYKKRELSVDGVSAQLWIITKVADNDAYYLENANSCTYLTLKDGLSADNTPIIGNKSTDGSSNQHWKFFLNSEGTAYRITNVASNTCVDLYYGGSDDGTAVAGWAWNGWDNVHQVWEVIRV
ncbi:ricin B-like lectin [Irpex lacteus]|nr:ricin B-like lectin [Irpex lacteus]